MNESRELKNAEQLEELLLLTEEIQEELEQKDQLIEYSCAMKSHFRKFGNQMSGSGNHLCNYASLLA